MMAGTPPNVTLVILSPCPKRLEPMIVTVGMGECSGNYIHSGHEYTM